jgi:hypothetical protein
LTEDGLPRIPAHLAVTENRHADLLLPHEDFKSTDIFFAFQHLVTDLAGLERVACIEHVGLRNKLPTWSARLMLLSMFPPAAALERRTMGNRAESDKLEHVVGAAL